MNKDKKLNVVLFILTIIVISFFINKINKYLDAKIDYANLECSDRAYMIYKNYDDQKEDFKDRDWSLRNSDCTNVKLDYQKSF